jgi:ethanolamine permease
MYILVLFVGASLPPGIGTLSVSSHPLADGLRLLFPGLTEKAAVGIASIGALSTVTPWLYAFSRQFFAMSRKGYVPAVFRKVWRGIPVMSVLFCCLTGYSLVLILILAEDPRLYQIVLLIGFLTTIFLYQIFTGVFIILRVYYKDLPRPFRSPFGIFGAASSFIIYTVMFVFLVQSDPELVGESTYIFLFLVVCWLAYYYLVSRKNLVLDADEKHAIINKIKTAHIIKTEHGFSYLERHCLKEHNPESLYCLKVT